MHCLDNSRKNNKRSRWSCWASSVGLLCSQGGLWMPTAVTHGSTPERWGDVAASVTDLWVPQKGNWIAGRFCTLAVFLFQAGEILLEVHYPDLNVWFQYFDITSWGNTEKLFCVILLILKQDIHLESNATSIFSLLEIYWGFVWEENLLKFSFEMIN